MKKKLIGVLFALVFICALSLTGSVNVFAEEGTNSEATKDDEVRLNTTELVVRIYHPYFPVHLESIPVGKKFKDNPSNWMFTTKWGNTWDHSLWLENAEGKDVEWYSTDGLICEVGNLGNYKGRIYAGLRAHVNGKCKIVAVVDGKELICNVTVKRFKSYEDKEGYDHYKLKASEYDLFKSNGEVNPKYNNWVFITKNSENKYYDGYKIRSIELKYDKTLKNGKIRLRIATTEDSNEHFRWLNGKNKKYITLTKKEAAKTQAPRFKITKDGKFQFGFKNRNGDTYEYYKIKGE